MLTRALPRFFSWPTLATFVAWALAAACVVFWGLKLSTANETPAIASATTGGATPPSAEAIAAVMGARLNQNATNSEAPTPVNTPASSRFSLQGVLQQGRGGVAVIAVEGKPPKHFRVGAVVDDGYVLLSVAKRSAQLGSAPDAPAAFTLELPAHSVMVSSAASPALASRPAAPGTPAVTAPKATVGFPSIVPVPPMNPAGASAANPEDAAGGVGRAGARGAPVPRGLGRAAGAAAAAATDGQYQGADQQQDR